MPFPTETPAGLFSRFGTTACEYAIQRRCHVMDECGRVCNKCVSPNSKRICLLSKKRVKCGCNCRCKGANKCKSC